MSDAEITSIASIAVPLIRNMDKKEIKALVKDVLADGVINADDLAALKAVLAETVTE